MRLCVVRAPPQGCERRLILLAASADNTAQAAGPHLLLEAFQALNTVFQFPLLMHIHLHPCEWIAQELSSPKF